MITTYQGSRPKPNAGQPHSSAFPQASLAASRDLAKATNAMNKAGVDESFCGLKVSGSVVPVVRGTRLGHVDVDHQKKILGA